MGTKTSNYQLNQWEPEDDFLRTDFNEDNAKIEAALNLKCEVIIGSYTGDDAESRTIELGFQPKAVFLCCQDGKTGYSSGSSYICGGLALVGQPLAHTNNGDIAMEITQTGFQVFYASYRRTNISGYNYYYIALR